jgi:hypothetical protein
MNKICTRWAKKIIAEIDGPFTAMTIREKLIEKHGTNYVASNISIGQFLARNCIVIGKRNERLTYKKREKNEN